MGLEEAGFNVQVDGALITEITEDGETEYSYDKRKDEAARSFDPANRNYSTYLSGGTSATDLDYATLENLANAPQSDVTKITQIIALTHRYVNKNDIIGITADSLENNVNTEIRLSYKAPKRGAYRKADIEEAKRVIADFNDKINLPKLITTAVTTTYIDGTFIGYCRKIETPQGTDYIVDYYPVGTALVSDYDLGGDPYVMMDMQALQAALSKSYPKNRKRKGLFFDNMEQEIKATYPPEVYKAYKDKEQYAILNIENTCTLRIGNQNQKYGLSPIFRALYPTLVLEAFEAADRMNAKARSKKIIVQVMNKEIMGSECNRDTYGDQTYAHRNFLDAWKQKIVVATLPPSVKEVAYVEPKAEMTDVKSMEYYRTAEMSTLGISFLMDGGSQSMSIANISLKQLMKRINRISKQLEGVLTKWYRGILRDHGLSPELAPDIQIIDAEMMEMGMKVELANVLFSRLNCSYQTAYETLGLSLEDEKIKREIENEEHLDKVFAPRLTAFTASGANGGSGGGGSGGGSGGGAGSQKGLGGKGGRTPAVTDDPEKLNKQAYDKERYDALTNG